MAEERVFRSDILVIGSGIAGSSAALEAAKRGFRVNIITQSSKPEESNTYYAQGGIVSLGPDDRPEILEEDIIKTGDGINNPESVEVLARQGREMVEKILRSQMSIEEKRGYADFVVDNSGPLAETQRQVEEIWNKLKKIQKERHS